MEKPIDFWLRTEGTAGRVVPTIERHEGFNGVGRHSVPEGAERGSRQYRILPTLIIYYVYYARAFDFFHLHMSKNCCIFAPAKIHTKMAKDYFAFISYQRKDEKWAKWLAYQLEHYHLPTTLNGRTNLPKDLRPVFRDIDELSAGNLPNQILQALTNSKFLIVICSPNAVKSEWVDKEISDFIRLKGADHVFPFIVGGQPFAQEPEQECFPEALRSLSGQEERLGANINEVGKSAAVVKLVSGLLDVSFDSLWKRFERERRLRKIGIACIVATVCLALGLTYWLSQTVEVDLTIQEQTPANDYLPPCHNIAVALYLDDDIKRDTLAVLQDTLHFSHVPPRYIGQSAQLVITADGYTKCDTLITLQRQQTISIARDADLYGNIRFRIIGHAHPEQLPIRIAGHEVQADKKGQVSLRIPIAEQRTTYAVEVQNHMDSIYMPCGADDVIVLEP